MSEFVVYEDTPFANYLQSIETKEATVKLPHIQTSKTPAPVIRRTKFTDAIYHYWRRSLFHDTFSVSLPIAEENAFEEKFKYLIVTSPLLNEILSVHPKKDQMEFSFHPSPAKPGRIGTVTTLSGLALAMGVEKVMQPRLLPITLLLASSTSIFFVYRHVRRAWIRQLYQTALSRLQKLTEECEAFDTKIHRALITIQEIELVSRGYRLSTPLSPISRIEQSSKSKRCGFLRNKLAHVLRRAFIVYEEGIIDLVDHVNSRNVSRLHEMYNVHSIASLSALEDLDGDDAVSLDYLKRLAQLMHSKRRECMLGFLALNVMTEEHDSVRRDYEDCWRAINGVLDKLVTETSGFLKEVLGALDTEFYKPTPVNRLSTPAVEDIRLRNFVHQLASLDQQLRTIGAKVYLCNDDIRQLDADEVRQRLKQEYDSIQQDLSQMASEWEAGRAALTNFLEPAPTPIPPKEDVLPSPLPSPTLDAEQHQKVIDADESLDPFDLPLPAKASVFEAISDVVERNTTERSRRSRAERIAEMKAKREEERKVKSSRMESQTMVHELKQVLDRRVAELDLEPEDKTAQSCTDQDDTSLTTTTTTTTATITTINTL
ncbi:hypothetical protein EC973_000179 [Apophysomyces ossiformis]|uniref:Inheritance of peroxisomes protein 2 n=1 Tax=Apophysomyces ossiformis TaxID=679940 RepID=A0A8H7C103_9FUNG|nr:hypothetical protein EC973_000179 [Apophysomyces ossiformis]